MGASHSSSPGDEGSGGTTKKPVRVALVGGSDVSRWKPSLHPRLDRGDGPPQSTSAASSSSSSGPFSDQVFVEARDGGTLAHLAQQIDAVITGGGVDESTFDLAIVAFATETDHRGTTAAGTSLPSIGDAVKDIQSALDATFPRKGDSAGRRRRLVVVGPRWGPCISDDDAARARLRAISEKMRRECERHPSGRGRVSYVDCLRMFCEVRSVKSHAGSGHGLSAHRSVPAGRYFYEDGLQLSDEGYEKLRVAIEEAIATSWRS